MTVSDLEESSADVETRETEMLQSQKSIVVIKNKVADVPELMRTRVKQLAVGDGLVYLNSVHIWETVYAEIQK
ncbi:hypothetical protein MP228_001555 [Amoeboaphelidium protococcarum]|nr:hypothetical protein MP228_001555 [Amoeboaphelidium protococcarum]